MRGHGRATRLFWESRGYRPGGVGGSCAVVARNLVTRNSDANISRSRPPGIRNTFAHSRKFLIREIVVHSRHNLRLFITKGTLKLLEMRHPCRKHSLLSAARSSRATRALMSPYPKSDDRHDCASPSGDHLYEFSTFSMKPKLFLLQSSLSFRLS
jgi:hypothetical protein